MLSLNILGQKSNTDFPSIINELTETKTAPSKKLSNKSATVIWSDSFDNASNWSIGAANLQGQWLVVNSTPSDVDQYMGAMASTSASDGFAVFNGVQYLLSGSIDVQDATLEMASSIDLSGYQSVSIEFEQRYRAFNYDETYVEFSNDNGVTWQQVLINDAVVTNAPALQEVYSLNISTYVGGSANAKIRFRWLNPSDDDNYGSGYGWMVDDVKITVLPDNDIQNLSSWIFGENSNGVEYGRTPVSQVEPNYLVGSYIYNYGALDQTNINVNGVFNGPSTFNTSATVAVIENDSSLVVENLETLSLSVGLYSGDIVTSSDADTLGSTNFTDNSFLRNFEITNDIYSLDGIGNHPAGYESLASTGTFTWATSVDNSSSDGFIVATMYNIQQASYINSVQVYLSSTTMAGAEVIVHILDTASFINGVIYTNDVYTSDIITIDASDVSSGYIEIPTITNSNNIWEEVQINPGAYYIAIEMNSLNNTYPIGVIDDNTVSQPAWASAIYFGLSSPPSSFTNGNAFAIRMKLSDGNVGMKEINENITIYPNPSNGIISITADNNLTNIVSVYDLTGKLLLSERIKSNSTIDLSKYNTGAYIVEVLNNNKIYTEKVILK
jgi:hypothetical protein